MRQLKEMTPKEKAGIDFWLKLYLTLAFKHELENGALDVNSVKPTHTNPHYQAAHTTCRTLHILGYIPLEEVGKMTVEYIKMISDKINEVGLQETVKMFVTSPFSDLKDKQ